MVLLPSLFNKGGIFNHTLGVSKNQNPMFDWRFLRIKYQYPWINKRKKNLKKDDNNFHVTKKTSAKYMNWFSPISTLKRLNKLGKDADFIYLPYWTIAMMPFLVPIYFYIKYINKRIKLILEIHNIFDHFEISYSKKISLLILRKFVNRSKVIFTHALSHQKFIKNNFGKETIIVPLPSNFKIDRNRPLGINKPIKIVFYGLVRKYKGIKKVIEAMDIILEKYNVQFIIAGEVWWGDKIIKNLKSKYNNKVSLKLNFMSDNEVIDVLSNSDIGLFCYETASQSGALIDALSFGLAVLVSDVGGLSETIQYGKIGVLLKENNVKEIVKELTILIENEDEIISLKNLSINYALDQYSWKKYYEKFNHVIL